MATLVTHWRCENWGCSSWGVFMFEFDEGDAGGEIYDVEVPCPLCTQPMARLDDPTRKLDRGSRYRLLSPSGRIVVYDEAQGWRREDVDVLLQNGWTLLDEPNTSPPHNPTT